MTERLFAKLFFTICAAASLSLRDSPVSWQYAVFAGLVVALVWLDWLLIAAWKSALTFWQNRRKAL